jgi:hypothetical protein
MYPVIGEPPSEPGAVKAIEALPLPAVAVPMVGAPGGVGVDEPPPPPPPQAASRASRRARGNACNAERLGIIRSSSDSSASSLLWHPRQNLGSRLSLHVFA